MEKIIHRQQSRIKKMHRNIVKSQDLDGPGMTRAWGKKLFQKIEVSKPVVSKKYIINRLERNNEILLQFKRWLDSYLYEPRTYELYERMEYLKDQIDTIRTKNSEIMVYLTRYRQSVGEYSDFIKYAFVNFHDLKRKIKEYMWDVRDGRPEPA